VTLKQIFEFVSDLNEVPAYLRLAAGLAFPLGSEA
jgi:hypothetical protein